ncbi:MAG: hypothetical protein ACRELY_24610, partial [Polyangiaceae bacterium]
MSEPPKKPEAKSDDGKVDAKPPFDWNTLFVFPEKIGWRDHALGGILAAIYVAILIITARTLGFARDESFYFSAGQSYAHWIELLMHDSARALDKG